MKKNRWLTPVVFLLLVALTVFAVSQQSKTFSAAEFFGYMQELKPWGMPAAIACMLGFILFEGLALLIICRALGYSKRLHHGIAYSAADIYFSAITPSATGGQPASGLMMVGDGIPTGVTTVALLLNLTFYTSAIFLIAIAGCLLYPDVWSTFGVPSHIMIIIGISLQVALLGGFILLVFYDKVFLRIIDFFLMLGQRLHLVKDAESRHNKMLEIEEDYRASAGAISSHKRAMAIALLFNVLQRVCNVAVPVVLYGASGGKSASLRKVFGIQTMVALGASSLPMPGGVGVTDYLFMDGYSSLLKDPVNLELLSRTVSFYSCVLLCAIMLLVITIVRKVHKTGGRDREKMA